ncbi:hypothetical protein NDS46_19795 [Paenibacillus thiaminolyticus]|uniref:hypothetical protein n=1 Tax=Paenibacillus thiaminolyticus TaxID=49283 RepID=UPI00233020DC|nr:hypothetical protein [Paenibacillus thiaminolyticus]WCF06585.1 hypothetical protein NDS46_19795 [Paenibacillus thiaminolyticus]
MWNKERFKYLLVFIIVFTGALGYYRFFVKGPFDQGELKKIAEQRLAEGFGMSFQAEKITYHPNENRSFYKIILHPVGHEQIKVRVSIPTDTGGEIEFMWWGVRGENFANILWGKYTNQQLEPIIKKILGSNVLFHTDIKFRGEVGYSTSGMVRDDHIVQTNVWSSAFEHYTYIVIFSDEKQFIKEQQFNHVYELVSKLNEIEWLNHHTIEVHFFNGTNSKKAISGAEEIQNYIRKNRENSLMSIKLLPEDLKLIRDSNDIRKYIQR